MGRAVALLRAVNVGGRTATKGQLTAALADAGLTEVSTFLASGNVLFAVPPTALSDGIPPASRPANGSDPTGQPTGASWSKAERAALELRIEGHLQALLGFTVVTFVRSDTELAALAAADPFPTADPSVTRQVAFLKTPATPAAQAAIRALSTDRDTLVVAAQDMWWLARDGIGRSALKPGALDTAAGQPVTARSVTTVRRLAALLQP